MLSKLFFSVAALVPAIVTARGKNDGSGRHDAITDELINNDRFIVQIHHYNAMNQGIHELHGDLELVIKPN